jgi:hypothetical protein
MDIRKIMDRCLVQQKKGLLMDAEIQKLVTEWQDVWGKAELDQATIDREFKTMEEKLNKYNVATLREVPTQREDGSFRILVCQMGGCSSKEVGELKIAATERKINKYKINLSAFMELNYNWAMVESLANLAFWFCHKEREIQLAAANNHHKTRQDTSPATLVWCVDMSFFNMQGSHPTTPFYCNPTHSTRIMVAYRTGSGKSKGLRTIYQQQIWYMQLHNLKGSPQPLFNKDLLHQCKIWRKSGKRIILLMDAKKHAINWKFNRVLTRTGLDLEEFTQKCWGAD